MSTNLYGPNDDFNVSSAHVLPALTRTCHEAKVSERRDVVVWGTDSPKRECLRFDALADGCVFLIGKYDGEEHVNIETGSDISVADHAALVSRMVFPAANIVFDRSKPDGAPRRVLDVS